MVSTEERPYRRATNWLVRGGTTSLALLIAFLSLGIMAPACAQSFSGIQIGVDASKVFRLLQKPPAKSDRDGPVSYYKWKLPSDNSLSITVTASDNKIVFMASDWGGTVAITDFPGFFFGRTTRNDLFKKFGSNGLFFKERSHIWGDKGSGFFSDVYETTETPPVTVAFITMISPEKVAELKQEGDQYFKAHLYDNAVLVSIMLGERSYVNSIWGAIEGTPAKYKRVSPTIFQTKEAGPQERAIEGVKLIKRNGALLVPVQINSKLEIEFIIDSGASDVQIPDDVFGTLLRTGTISENDFLGTSIYVLADGSKVPSRRYVIRKLQVGPFMIEDVTASVGNMQSDPLLGQSFLKKFRSWALDNDNELLILSVAK